MKRQLILLLCALLLLLSGCSPIVDAPAKETLIYTTFSPLQAIASLVVKDIPNVRMKCLTDPQIGCMRSYSLSDRDLALLSASADGVLAFGSGMESFTDSLESLSESAFWLAELLPGQELYRWKKATDEDEQDHYLGPNPYSYLSCKGGLQLVEAVEGMLCLTDEEHAELYHTHAKEAKELLDSLGVEITEITASCHGVRAAILHEALFYCAEEYGMEIAAVIERESGTLLYGQELTDCIDTLKKNEVQVILLESHAPKALTDALEAEGFGIVRLNILDLTNDYPAALRANAEEAARVCAAMEENT